jgi:hypothetical protein
MSDMNKPSDDGSESVPKPTRKLPDMAICQVRRSGMADLVICMVSDSSNCEYCERHAFDTFCFHPQWQEILDRTDAR